MVRGTRDRTRLRRWRSRPAAVGFKPSPSAENTRESAGHDACDGRAHAHAGLAMGFVGSRARAPWIGVGVRSVHLARVRDDADGGRSRAPGWLVCVDRILPAPGPAGHQRRGRLLVPVPRGATARGREQPRLLASSSSRGPCPRLPPKTSQRARRATRRSTVPFASLVPLDAIGPGLANEPCLCAVKPLPAGSSCPTDDATPAWCYGSVASASPAGHGVPSGQLVGPGDLPGGRAHRDGPVHRVLRPRAPTCRLPRPREEAPRGARLDNPGVPSRDCAPRAFPARLLKKLKKFEESTWPTIPPPRSATVSESSAPCATAP